MESLKYGDATIAPFPPARGAPASPVGEPVRVIALCDRRNPTTLPYDDLRQLAVMVWARTKLVERLLDALEDALPRRAA